MFALAFADCGNSQDINRPKLRLTRQAGPQIDGKANIAGPQRVAAAPKLVTCSRY
jgi:hypothetical protein